MLQLTPSLNQKRNFAFGYLPKIKHKANVFDTVSDDSLLQLNRLKYKFIAQNRNSVFDRRLSRKCPACFVRI